MKELKVTPVETASPDSARAFLRQNGVRLAAIQEPVIPKLMVEFASQGATELRKRAELELNATINGLMSQLTQVQAKYSKAMRAIESLTPSGSEFVGDVENCVAHVRQRQESQHKVIVSFSKRAKAADLELTQVREELRQVKAKAQEDHKCIIDQMCEARDVCLARAEKAELELGKAEAENKRPKEELAAKKEKA